jgi:transcriptional regulator with XRE-family HTH domain
MKSQSLNDQPFDFELIGFNVRCSRMAQNKTQAELAGMAGTDRATIRRLEGGSRVHFRSLEKICSALGRSVDLINSVMPYGLPGQRRRTHVHRKEELSWFANQDHRKRVPKENQKLLQSEEERLRLARLGLVTIFEGYMATLPYGPSISKAEICGVVSIGPHQTYRECIVVCLRGEVLIRTEEEVVEAGEGDSVGFNTDDLVTIEPAYPIGADGLPPIVFFVMANRRGHSPIEIRRTQRKRIRHSEFRGPS